MSLIEWYNNKWLHEHQTSRDEIAGFLEKAKSNIQQSKIEDITLDWRLEMAYRAVMQLSTIALNVLGYRTVKGANNHYYTIESLKYTLDIDEDFIYILQKIRQKRNNIDYDAMGTTSKPEVDEAIASSEELLNILNNWLQENHKDLL